MPLEPCLNSLFFLFRLLLVPLWLLWLLRMMSPQLSATTHTEFSIPRVFKAAAEARFYVLWCFCLLEFGTTIRTESRIIFLFSPAFIATHKQYPFVRKP
jgi:hypothetical protein